MCKYQNIGNVQRIIRVIVGIAILGVGIYYYKSNWAYIGLIPLITGLIGNCPACYLGKLPICLKKSDSKDEKSCGDESCDVKH